MSSAVQTSISTTLEKYNYQCFAEHPLDTEQGTPVLPSLSGTRKPKNNKKVLFTLKTRQQKHLLLGKSARSSDGGNGKRVAEEGKD